jgi:biopolymer transport protein TolQ
MNALSLITETGWVAKSVMLLLLGASIACWSIIFNKWKCLGRAQTQNARFIQLFWNSKSMDEILIKSEKIEPSPVSLIFQAGLKELRRFAPQEVPFPLASADKMDNLQRSLQRSSLEQMADLEKHLNWLATTASAAPFIGLFGTVWGIMNSFHSIAATGNANLAIVAPGITEALITTAIGIGVAIPAVVAYNYFVGEMRKIALQIESFTGDFMNIVQRSSLQSRRNQERP